MGWAPKVGRRVKYRNASGRYFTARITKVNSATSLDLKVGEGTKAFTVAAATKNISRLSTAAGWMPSWSSARPKMRPVNPATEANTATKITKA